MDHKRIGRLTARVDPHHLGLQVGIERFATALAAKAAALVAAERCHVTHGTIAVHPHRAGFDALRHANRAADVTGPHAGRQTIVAVVRNRERLLFIGEGDDREHGPEHLFARNAHAVVYPREDRRLYEPACAETRILRNATAQHALCAGGTGDLDVVEYSLQLLPGGDGTDLRVGEFRIAEARRSREPDQLVDDLIVDAALNEQARAREASLAARREDARYWRH